MKNGSPILILLIFIACSTSTEPNTDNSLAGTVYDHAGNAVIDALIEIEYRYEFETAMLKSGLHPFVNTTIRFSVPEANHVKLWISNYAVDDTIIKPIDSFLNAGSYSYMWNGYSAEQKLVTSNVYQYHIGYQSNVSSKYFMVMNNYDHIENPDILYAYASTNTAGAFSIPYNQLAFSHGLEFTITDENGYEIGSSAISSVINVWAMHKQHGKTAVYNLNVSKESSNIIKLHY